jgi:hypothetical protein
MGKPILVKENQFQQLLKDCNISLLDTEKLDIYFDSDRIFCSIHGVSIKKIDEALKEGVITEEKHKELIEQFKL